jgi:predicted ATPase/DNA-binding SARP family transcriptional activator
VDTNETLEIRVLGPFEVLANGCPANVSGSKRHALLALLALHRGRVVGVDALVDALWGEDLPAAPRNALQHHVARVRAVLGQEAIIASSDGYALAETTVDALLFEELLAEARASLREGDARAGARAAADAQNLWRGAALHALTDTLWFRAEAERLEALRVDALEEQFEAALALGDHREIVPALRVALEESPFRERLWGQLMLALYRSGRQADALDTFQRARSVLSEQLGLEPGPELQRLQAAILAHDPAVAPVPVPPRRRGKLPAATTSFVDREQELADVVELLREHRLVTLTGPPGVGKSRLGLEVARALEGDVVDGVWLVELARVAGASDVAALVARAVDARGPDPLAAVIVRLRDTDGVLLLDGCGRVVEEAARVAAAVLRECAGVRVLATSREVLHVLGEARVTLAPLPVPDAEARDGEDSPSVQLFTARARAVRPEFAATPEAARFISEIVRQLDGLPLALELAAARVNALGLRELLSRVEHRFSLLGDRPSSDPARAGLETLIAWSYDLLEEEEKTLLHRIAVHRGGSSLASLVAAGAADGLDEAAVTHLVGTLADKSIVSVSFPDGEARYDLLDTVRDYALERLDESRCLAAARAAHSEYFAALADAARMELRGRDWLAWTRLIDREHDNFWAALTYARDAPDPLLAARLAAGLGWYFGIAERVSEGRAFVEVALALAESAPLPLRVELLGYLCYLATEEGDLAAAVEAGERGLALAGTGEAPWETALVKLALAFAYDLGQDPRAASFAADARCAFEEVGDTWGAASSTLTGAIGALTEGDLASAAALNAEAVRLHGDYDVGAVPAALLGALLAERRGETEAAADAYRESLERSERAGFADHASFALSGLGSLAFADGNYEEAQAYFRRALAVADATSEAWLVAHARVRLAQVLKAVGDAEAATNLYRTVIAWSEEPRRHQAREGLFFALAGSPVTAALLGLAEIVSAGGDPAAADALRERAGLALA